MKDRSDLLVQTNNQSDQSKRSLTANHENNDKQETVNQGNKRCSVHKRKKRKFQVERKKERKREKEKEKEREREREREKERKR